MDTAARPRILLVDDEPVVGNLHAALLEGAGYTATLASCAEEALALLARTSFDLLFLDLYFPGTGGWELLGRVRERFGPSKLPVVMISGEANPTVRASLLSLGADDFLIKPVTPARLLGAARRWIRSGGGDRDDPPTAVAAAAVGGKTVTARGKVLVVDDDRVTCEILSDGLGSVGFGVECVSRVADCLKRIDAGGVPPIALIVDIYFPEADGLDLMRELASRKCSSPLIIITGVSPDFLAVAGEFGRAWGLTILDTMKKPLRLDRLYARLASLSLAVG